MPDDLSPMQREFWNFDLANPTFTPDQYKLMVQTAFSKSHETINPLLIEEIKWRKAHGMNCVMSGEGWQGAGKSRGFCYLGWLIGTIYGIHFTPENIYWRPKDLDDALSKAKFGETFLKDEHQYRNVGIMSHVIMRSLADYENQLRENMNNLLFASVRLQEHNHFFVFEFLYPTWTEKNGKPYPKSFVAVLKTPKYGDRFQFVWRGIVEFPMISEEFDKEYDKRKKEHIANLMAKYGNNLDFIGVDTKEMLEQHEENFVKITLDGIVKPKPAALIEHEITELKGSEIYTRDVMKIVIEKIKEMIEKKYYNQNLEIEKRLSIIAQEKAFEKEKTHQESLEKKDSLNQKRLELFQRKVDEQKRHNDLKLRMLELKENAAMQLAEAIKMKKEMVKSE